jgi:hypothetical protein
MDVYIKMSVFPTLRAKLLLLYTIIHYLGRIVCLVFHDKAELYAWFIAIELSCVCG